MKKILTIAGSDTSGGAGIQADLKTFNNLDTYGMCALTTIMTMDYKNDWAHVPFNIETLTLTKQLNTVFEGIRPHALKTGMLPTAEIINLVGTYLEKFDGHIVIDPVLACKGTKPMFSDTVSSIQHALLPHAFVATPNLLEAALLTDSNAITTLESAKVAAKKIHAFGAENVTIKAIPTGDAQVTDILFDGNNFYEFPHEKLSNVYTSGAGCTFSAAIAAELGKGSSVLSAVETASNYVFNAIKNSQKLNEYTGMLVPEK